MLKPIRIADVENTVMGTEDPAVRLLTEPLGLIENVRQANLRV